MTKLLVIATSAVTFLALVVGFTLLFAIPVWLLWNWLCPALFGLPAIGLLQAWGLTFLCGFLFRPMPWRGQQN